MKVWGGKGPPPNGGNEMTTRDFFNFGREIDRHIFREEMERMGPSRMNPEDWKPKPVDHPTFPNDDRRPNIGPPKMMRCG